MAERMMNSCGTLQESKDMKVIVNISLDEAIKEGNLGYGSRVIEVDTSKLSAKERDILATARKIKIGKEEYIMLLPDYGFYSVGVIDEGTIKRLLLKEGK